MIKLWIVTIVINCKVNKINLFICGTSFSFSTILYEFINVVRLYFFYSSITRHSSKRHITMKPGKAKANIQVGLSWTFFLKGICHIRKCLYSVQMLIDVWIGVFSFTYAICFISRERGLERARIWLYQALQSKLHINNAKTPRSI